MRALLINPWVYDFKAFARALKENGIDVEGDAGDGFTETHQVVIRVRKYGSGNDIALRLEKNNIIANYQALPDDESFLEASGIRMGVQEMTRFGMKEQDFKILAGYLAEVITGNKNVKEEIKKLRERFLEMKYCLPVEEAAPLAAKIFASILPHTEFFKLFANNLAKTTKI